MKDQKIIIIGAGIGGMMTAIAMNAHGCTPALYEKNNSHDANGAGLAVWANATSILDKFGLLKQVLPYSSVLSKIKFNTSGGKFLSEVRLKKLEDKFHFPSLLLLRKDLQNVLLNAIPTGQIYYNKSCVSVENTAHSVLVHFAD